jgi:hypothetical protein
MDLANGDQRILISLYQFGQVIIRSDNLIPGTRNLIPRFLYDPDDIEPALRLDNIDARLAVPAAADQ